MKQCMAVVLSLLMLAAFVVTASAETELTIIMDVEQSDDGSVNVTLTDNEEGTVSNWPVTMWIDGEEVLTLNTDYNGEATFDVEIPEDAQEVSFSAIDGGFDEYTFKGCTVYLDGTQATNDGDTETTTAQDDVETTTAPQTDTTKIPQGALVTPEDSLSISPRTTAVNGDLIGIGIDVDNGVLNASQNLAMDYTTSARMWMDAEQYTALVSEAKATVHLQLSMNADAGSKSILIDAKNADPKYASFIDTQVKGYAMDLSIVYIDDIGRKTLEIPDGIYTVEIPVPAVMKSCEKIAIAVCTEDGLSSFVNVKPVSGVLTFTVQRLQTLAIVGFGEQGQGGTMTSLSTTAIVLIAVGAVLVTAAILLLAFVVFRRKKAEKKAADPLQNRDETHLLIVPTADEEIEKIDPAVIESEQAKAVLIDYDEQSVLDDDEREQFRAKADIAAQSLDNLPETSVSPVEQISSQQMETIRRAVAEEQARAEREALTVDDLLDMLDSDLEDLNS